MELVPVEVLAEISRYSQPILRRSSLFNIKDNFILYVMPRVNDITGDLGKLREHKVFPSGERPHSASPVQSQLERKPAFNPASFFFWTLVVLFIGLQFGFLAWLA
jgi:hypothetical protein